ncbi:MAG: hypothetical protein ACYC0V_13870 [Armatimonadota bacterium]
MSKARKYIVITAKVIFTVLFGIFFLAICWSALHPSTMIPLPMGYRMWATDEAEQIIEIEPNLGFSYKENGKLISRRVGPDVDEFRVYDNAIIGHVKKSGEFTYVSTNPGKIDNDEDIIANPKKPGYFVIDLTANKVYGGLSKKEWNERLKKLGIENDPRLLKPTI